MKKLLMLMSVLMIGSQVIGSQMIGSNSTISNFNDDLAQDPFMITTAATMTAIALDGITDTLQPAIIPNNFFIEREFLTFLLAGITTICAYHGENVEAACCAGATLFTGWRTLREFYDHRQ